jgi:hypothetical protein
MGCLLLFSLIVIFNKAGDFESFICHADEPRREPRYIKETSVCFGLRRTIEDEFEDNSISPTLEDINPNARNILKPQLRIRSPYVIEPGYDHFTDEEMQNQLALQARLKNPSIINKKVQ